jgi:hypothetical protein
MAKRTPPEEQEYRPVNEQLARSVLAHKARPVPQDEPPAKVDEPPAPEPPTEDEPPPEPPQARAQSTPSPKVVTAKRGRTPKATETPKEPVRAKRKEMTIERRMMLSPEEDRLLEELVSGIRTELRVKANGSNVLRACVTLLFHVQEEVLKQCRRMATPQPPRKDDPTSIRVFEEHLARLFDSAIRNTKSLD